MNSIASIIGLILDIIGALLLWMYGLPPEVRRTGHSFLRFSEVDENEVRKAKRYDLISHGGMALLVAGFVFQLLGCLLPRSAF